MRHLVGVAVVAGVVLSACTPRIAELPPAVRERPANFPAQVYQQAAAQGKPVLRVDPASSIVVIEVRRAGSLAHLGHDHVVASHDVQGYLLPETGRADLYVALAHLVVDEPALRAEAGFDTRPSVSDIAGTRRNMLEHVLDAGEYPFVLVGVRRIDNDPAAVEVSIGLHGVTRVTRVPVQFDGGPDDRVVAGRLTLNQTEFGIAPLSVLGGAIQVQDAVDLRFRIRATRFK